MTAGQTDLDPDEADGLIPEITTRSELNDFEYEAIETARRWLYRRRWTISNLLCISAMVEIHKRMFREVWRWAGEFRRTEKNIGVAPFQVSTKLRQLLDDTQYWIEHNTYDLPELLARFHHGLVFIHPFPNGNGRFGRLATEALCLIVGYQMPSWSLITTVADERYRERYLSALRTADRGEFEGLVEFMFPKDVE